MMDRHEELLRTTTTTALLEGLFNADDGVVWQVFDERYRPIMVGIGRRLGLSDSEAEDVAQETLLQFLRDYRANRYDRDKGRLRGWIAGITRHRVIDYQRKRGRRKEKSGGLSSLLEVPDEAGIADPRCGEETISVSALAQELRREGASRTQRGPQLAHQRETAGAYRRNGKRMDAYGTGRAAGSIVGQARHRQETT